MAVVLCLLAFAAFFAATWGVGQLVVWADEKAEALHTHTLTAADVAMLERLSTPGVKYLDDYDPTDD